MRGAAAGRQGACCYAVAMAGVPSGGQGSHGAEERHGMHAMCVCMASRPLGLTLAAALAAAHLPQKSDLARMYRMFNRLPKGLEPMADIFCKHVEEEGEGGGVLLGVPVVGSSRWQTAASMWGKRRVRLSRGAAAVCAGVLQIRAQHDVQANAWLAHWLHRSPVLVVVLYYCSP